MMYSRVMALLALATLAAAKPDEVVLDKAAQSRIGLQTAPLVAARSAATFTGFATVLDSGPLATLEAETLVARAAAAASSNEARRSHRLAADQQVLSTKAAETAQAQSTADAARLQLLKRRMGLEWGNVLASMRAERRSDLLSDLAAGRAAMIRIDSPGGWGLAGHKRLTVKLPFGDQATATVLGPARVADPRLRSYGLLAIVRGQAVASLSTNLAFPVTLSEGARDDGVIVPRSALLRIGGETHLYLESAPGRFERRTLMGLIPRPEGLFTGKGLRPGQIVVISGGAALAALQRKSLSNGD